MNAIDLHIHSSCSDSSKSIRKILDEAKDKKMKMISITDHDTMKAYELMKQEELPCKIIKGIEISAQDSETKASVHVLGYGLEDKTPHIDTLCASTLQAMQERSLWQIQQLIQHGYAFDLEEVLALANESTAIYKQHIMQVLIQHGYSDSIYSKVYRSLFKNKGICEKAITFPSCEEAIEAIHQDGGIAVLAHPFTSHIDHLIKRFADMGMDGIETGHSSHNEDQMAYLHEKALRYELLETGGSDDHGHYGEEPQMGENRMEFRGMEELACKVKCWR